MIQIWICSRRSQSEVSVPATLSIENRVVTRDTLYKFNRARALVRYHQVAPPPTVPFEMHVSLPKAVLKSHPLSPPATRKTSRCKWSSRLAPSQRAVQMTTLKSPSLRIRPRCSVDCSLRRCSSRTTRCGSRSPRVRGRTQSDSSA
jgi:hypothetical protein